MNLGDAWRHQASRQTLEDVVMASDSALFGFLGSCVESWTVEYARTNEIGSRTSFVIASVRSSIH